MFFFFKPLAIKELTSKEVPQFEFQHFTMYELDTKGLKTKMLGSSAAKYIDRYEIKDINYTDNTQHSKANMLAKKGIYYENIIYLDENVTYTSMNKNRFQFHTEFATYNTKNSIVESEGNYTLFFTNGEIVGTYIRYNIATNKVLSKNVRAIYKLQEEE